MSSYRFNKSNFFTLRHFKLLIVKTLSITRIALGTSSDFQVNHTRASYAARLSNYYIQARNLQIIHSPTTFNTRYGILQAQKIWLLLITTTSIMEAILTAACLQVMLLMHWS